MLPGAYVLPARLVTASIHLHHRLRGPRGDYLGLAGAAFASWAGLPGPGEAALVGGGILAAHHKLDLASILVVAWLGAMLGGVVGWAVGMKAGRGVLTARGPLRQTRLAALARGDRFFERYGMLAVFFTPSWIAGIHRMPLVRFAAANAAAALVWSLGIGIGSFLVGPSVTDLVDDLGTATSIVIGAALLVAVIGVLVRRRRGASG